MEIAPAALPGDSLTCATEAGNYRGQCLDYHSDATAVAAPVSGVGQRGRGPCDAMAPILEELRNEYPGQVVVEFFDVKKDMAPARQYGIRVIPTQIFLDAQGKEVFRHEGFFPKAEILPVLAKLGVNI